ncbi:hypothetical protein F4775DRAFT_457010 [Biscogniauxia sp. FL1348]|nr:hypothetical protein F4775DRAFT_457010 [Biscogniauxia sp. FL1348]
MLHLPVAEPRNDTATSQFRQHRNGREHHYHYLPLPTNHHHHHLANTLLESPPRYNHISSVLSFSFLFLFSLLYFFPVLNLLTHSSKCTIFYFMSLYANDVLFLVVNNWLATPTLAPRDYAPGLTTRQR